MAMMTSRRTAIGAGLLAIPAAVTAATIAAPAASGDTAEWDKAMAERDRAKIAMDEAEREYERTTARFRELRGEAPSTSDLCPYSNRDWLLNTADLDDLERATLNNTPPEKSRRLEAIGRVREYRAAGDRAAQSTGYVDVCERYDDTTNAFCAIEARLLGMPAPNVAALLWKLEYALNTDDGHLQSYTAAHMAQTKADMRRLLGKGA